MEGVKNMYNFFNCNLTPKHSLCSVIFHHLKFKDVEFLDIVEVKTKNRKIHFNINRNNN